MTAPGPAQPGLQAAPGWGEALPAAGLGSIEALFAVQGVTLGKPGLADWRERVRVEIGIRGAARTFYVKRYLLPPASARREVRRSACGARSVAGVEWAWMAALAADGIPCVEPVAMAEEFDGRRERRSVLVTAEVPGESLEKLALRLAAAGGGASSARAVRPLLEATADLVARFHQRGYVHRDLYLCHIFCDPSLPPGEGLRLIDLQRVLRPRWRRRRWVVKDLAALEYSTPRAVVSRSRRLAWLKRYLGLVKLDGRARRLARAVGAKARAIGRRDGRRAGREIVGT